MTTIRDALRAVKKDVAQNEVEIILAHALKKDRTFILAHPEQKLSARNISRLNSLLNRRKQNEPLAYILGRKEFFGRDFFVNNNTLIPRPETETLVDIVMSHIESEKKYREKKLRTLIIDIGTGSGNIIITLIKEFEKRKYDSLENFSFFAIDISREALSISRKNAKKYGVEKCIQFTQSDMFSKFPKKIFQQTSSIIILANLPYLSTREYEKTSNDIQRYEPKIAIESGRIGLEHSKKLLDELRKILEKEKREKKDVSVFFEIGSKQKKQLENYALRMFPQSDVRTSKDLFGKWRFVLVHFKKTQNKKTKIPTFTPGFQQIK